MWKRLWPAQFAAARRKFTWNLKGCAGTRCGRKAQWTGGRSDLRATLQRALQARCCCLPAHGSARAGQRLDIRAQNAQASQLVRGEGCGWQPIIKERVDGPAPRSCWGRLESGACRAADGTTFLSTEDFSTRSFRCPEQTSGASRYLARPTSHTHGSRHGTGGGGGGASANANASAG